MDKITEESIVDLAFQLKWKSADADHHETYLAGDVNVWRDYLPSRLKDPVDGEKDRRPGKA